METSIKLLERYYEKYQENITTDNAQEAIAEFDENWKYIPNPYRDTDDEIKLSKYGYALSLLSIAYCLKPDISQQDIQYLSDLINEYDTNQDVKYQFNIKQALYNNIGLCWHKLAKDDKAIEAFKKQIYYLITDAPAGHHNYAPTAYAFKKCRDYLFEALEKEELNLSSPATFNDPFDCPISVLLDNDEIVSKLMLKAYQDCLRVACLTNNVKLPYVVEDTNSNSYRKVDDEKKHEEDEEGYLNELMWAHYADSHKGICIKYKFHHSVSQIGDETPGEVSYFKDIKYSNEELAKYSSKDSINMEDAFFLKGKNWEYENELRFLHFNINDHYDPNNHETAYRNVKIPGCIEAIYFGLNCLEDDKKKIIDIMRLKKFVQKDINDNILSESPIQFYQIKIDKKHIGQIIAERLP